MVSWAAPIHACDTEGCYDKKHSLGQSGVFSPNGLPLLKQVCWPQIYHSVCFLKRVALAPSIHASLI